jgi:hypothetical protein
MRVWLPSLIPFWHSSAVKVTPVTARVIAPSIEQSVWSKIVVVVLFPALCLAECIPYNQAREHIGETRCVSGKVLRVKHGARGVTFFDYCEDFRVCPFTVVVFPGKLKDIGDVRQLENKTVEIHGVIKKYDGRAEIVLDHVRQLSGEAALLPPLPKNYDVEKTGHYSAGTFRHAKAKQATTKKKQSANMPVEIPEDQE